METSRHYSTAGLLLTTYALGGVACVWSAAFRPDWLPLMLSLTLAGFFGFTITHAVGRLGCRNALVFLGVALIISLGFELLGVVSGAIFGRYYYTDRLAPKLFGLVPAAVPVAWFTMMYVSHALAELLATKASPVQRAGLAAVITTAWDLALDPAMVATGHWVWMDGGAYFGIPLQNFVGWLATSFTAFLAYTRVEKPRATRPRCAANLTLAIYALTALASAAAALTVDQRGAALVGLIVMGSFLLAGLARAGHLTVPARLGDSAGFRGNSLLSTDSFHLEGAS
jgi:putative membrane protein